MAEMTGKRAEGMSGMRLGIVMTGAGALGWAGAGVMTELERRGIEPFAVCGMGGGAWPAAMVMAGRSAEEMRAALGQAACMGRRMLKSAGGCGALLAGRRAALIDAGRLEHLLSVQASARMLCLCPRPGILPCRAVQSGRKVIFSTREFDKDSGSLLSMQPSVSFAARAAMTAAPFLRPVEWMGSPVMAEYDAGYACRQLLLMGAQRVLVVQPVLSPRRRPDALDLTAAACGAFDRQPLPAQAALLRIDMPPEAGALSADRLALIAGAAQWAARSALDSLMDGMGMAYCRVLPFSGYALMRRESGSAQWPVQPDGSC